MAPGGFRAALLAAALLPACASAALPAPSRLPAGAHPGPSPGDGPTFAPGPPPRSGDRVTGILGAWGFLDGRVNGDAEGARTDAGAAASGAVGYSVAFRAVSPGGEVGSSGILLEHFHDVARGEVRGGDSRTVGTLSAAWLTLGLAGEPRAGTIGDEGFSLDVLVGFRRAAVSVEVPDGTGGTRRESSVWPELAAGLRAEWAPIPRVALFAGAEAGGQFAWDDFWEEIGEEETEEGGDLGSSSAGFSCGVRIRPVDHLSLLLGWRTLRLDGKRIHRGGSEETPTARATWSGVWGGVEIDF